MLRVVLDTNVLVSAIRSRKGASFALVSMLPSDLFEITLSVPLYTEYQDVLTRAENITGLNSREDVLKFIRYLAKISYKKEIFFLWRPWLKDPKDDMVLELAVASDCDYIVTFNTRDFKNIDTFKVEAIEPRVFLEILK